jgi:hypothetical protein
LASDFPEGLSICWQAICKVIDDLVGSDLPSDCQSTGKQFRKRLSIC